MSLSILSGKWKGRKLKSPPESTTRPTQSVLRAAVCNMCQEELNGAFFLDCFAGSGAMGLEALSRGAAHATFIEKDRRAFRTLCENISLLQAEELSTVYSYSAEKALLKIERPFDLLYLDPPYGVRLEPILSLLLERQLWKKGGRLFIEQRKGDPEPCLEDLGLVLASARSFGAALLLEVVS